MQKRKSTILGILTAAVMLAVLLGVMLSGCVETPPAASSAPVQTEAQETTILYWNADAPQYRGMSEAGLSSREPESDGFYHIRFVVDGQEVVLTTADRKLVNKIDSYDLMGLVVDGETVSEVIPVTNLPVEMVAWQFYVQSIGGNLLKLNSSSSMNGIELLLELEDCTRIYDMTGTEGEVGTEIKPISMDRVYCIRDAEGHLTHIFVYDRPNYMTTHEGHCQHCDQTVTWNEWIKTDALPTHTGHYQLQNDVQLSGQLAQPADTKICLDLNGHRVDGGNNKRLYSLHNSGAEFALMDTSEAQTGTLVGHGTSAQGLVVWVRYGRFYLYGGTLDASDCVSTKNGTAVCVEKNTYFYMHGGTIIGGTAATQYNATTKKYTNGVGGSLYVTGGKFTMYDGEIRDGYAKSLIADYNADGSPKTYMQGKGGNIYVGSSGILELYGGVIKNGRAGYSGGNLYASANAEVLLDGTKIQGGSTSGKGRNGGSVYLTSTVRMTMLSGSITGGSCRNGGGNMFSNGIFIMSGGYIGGGVIRDYYTGKVKEDAAHRNVFLVNGTFRMYGGKIDGGFRATDSNATDKKTCYVGLSQHAVIDGGENSKNNLTLSLGAGGPVTVRVDQLLDDAKIRVNAVTGLFSDPTSETNLDNFYSDIPGAEVVYYDGRLGLGKVDCLCGKRTHVGNCDGTDRFWAPLTATTNIKAGGNYYLTKDMTTDQLSLGAGIVSAVDLNGYTLTASSSNVFLVNGEGAHLDLTDHAGGGKVVGKGFSNGSQGGTVYVRVGSMDIYGGTLTGTEDMHKAGNGGILSVRGTVNMYGGTITGGKADNGGNVAITSTGSMSIYGGTITDGTATKGSNIYVSAKSLTLAGGKIDGGIQVDGTPTLTLTGAPTVTSANNGLTIPAGVTAKIKDLSSSASISVNVGGYFAEGATTGNDACFTHVNSNLDVALDGNRLFVGRMACLCGQNPHIGACDGQIIPWTPLVSASDLLITGNYYLINNMTTGQLSLKSNVVVSLDLNGYSLTATSSRVFMPYDTTTLNIVDHAGGGKVLGKGYASGKEAQGGVIYAREGSVLNIYGGTISGSSSYGAGSYGGIIFVRGVMNMYGGAITGGKATLNGGTVSVSHIGVCNIYDGTISGGTAPAGNTIGAIGTGKLNIYGGSIADMNVAENTVTTISGGNVEQLTVNGATLKLSGAPVIGNLLAQANAPITAAGALTTGASITVSKDMADGVFTDNTLGAYAAFFSSEDEDRGVYAIDNAAYGDEVGMLYLGRYNCLCGQNPHVGSCDGNAIKWTALTETASLKTGGTFYLTEDMTTSQLSLGAGIVTNLDLNGHDLIASVSNVFLINGNANTRLSLCDHAGGGTLQGRGFETASQGGAVYIRAGNMDLYSGTICKAANYQLTNHGGLISVRGTLNMYGGTLTGGISEQYGGNMSVSSSGICNIHGGTIVGGTSPKGGNICVTGSAKLFINGGTIEGGIASESGGNIYVDKQNTVTFSMTGGSAIGGTATTSGGNIFVLDTVGTKSITGGTITGGTAPTGSCVYVAAGTLTVGENATIEKLETP